MAQIKVIHLEIEGEHHYFGSPKAMFDIIGKERMGMTYQSFHSNIHLKLNEPYVNRRKGYIIRVGLMGQAKTNRNSRKNYIPQAVAASTNVDNVAANASTLVAPAAQGNATVPQENLNPFAPMPEANPMAPEPKAKETKPANETHKRKKKDKDIPEQLTLF